jgi:pyruvate dehydrogenase E2 component (dihydrolipoamide acetyltransferase)
MNVELKLSGLGEKIERGDVVSVLVREGDVVAPGDAVVEVETEKAVVEIPCPFAGVVAKVLVQKGQTVNIGQPLLSVEVEELETMPDENGKKSNVRRSRSGMKTEEKEMAHVSRPHPSPLPEGEGTERVEGVPAQRGTREPAVPPGQLDRDDFGHVRREKMSKNRQAAAAEMLRSIQSIPRMTNFDDADVTDLERMRKTVPPAYLGPTVKLTAMPFVLKAVAMALRQHPALNAGLDARKHEIVYKQYVNVGVTIDTPRGPVVPVIRNVDRMSLLSIARELTLLAARARTGDFSMEEFLGGTFTLSNLGAVGGVYSTPLIRPSEVGALLLGRSRWVLGVFEGKIEGRLKMPLSLSYDLRVVDGVVAGRFLNDVIDYLQTPGKLLLTR